MERRIIAHKDEEKYQTKSRQRAERRGSRETQTSGGGGLRETGRTRKGSLVRARIKEGRTKASGGAVHEGREDSIEREMEVVRPIEGVWKTRRKSGAGEDAEERCGGGREGGGLREVKSPEDGPRPVSRAASSVVIQEE